MKKKSNHIKTLISLKNQSAPNIQSHLLNVSIQLESMKWQTFGRPNKIYSYKIPQIALNQPNNRHANGF